MAQDKISPPSKPVKGKGVVDGGHSTLTTPKKDTGGKFWGVGKGSTEKIFKK